MNRRHPCGGLGRRAFLAGAAAPWLAAAASGAGAAAPAQPPADPGPPRLGLPGPYPGRVVEVRHPAMIRDGVKSADAVRDAVAKGMTGLTGADDAVGAWRRFFEPGDVVGVKINPVGYPLAESSAELIRAVVGGLESAGVRPRDVVVFDRYRDAVVGAKVPGSLPDGVSWAGLGVAYHAQQVDLKGDDLRAGDLDHVVGYDPDAFVEMDLVGQGEDPKDDRNRRSHLGLLVTRRVNKVVLLPALKDHGSAGITGALKNMSHGLVNNVNRSHSAPGANACNLFIPQVVNHPVIRAKCVLQIMDGLRGVFQGGPSAWKPEWTWENNALLFATDPVAMDHVAWRALDAKRVEKGLPPVGEAGLLGRDAEREGFDVRQPQHVRLAANLGLGIFDFRSPKGARHSISHRVVTMT